MYKKILFFLIFPCFLLSVDSDFDGVEDNMDDCLETDILVIVNAHGCAKGQKPIFNITILQNYAYVDIDTNNKIDNYSLAMMVNKDSWLFYIGSGYFNYDSPTRTLNDFSDTTFLIQKTFVVKKNHYIKSSLSTILPTYRDANNKVDYGMDIAYGYFYEKFDFELGYQYDWIKDIESQNIETIYFYGGYTLGNSFHAVLGYNEDNDKRKSKIFLLQYLVSDKINLSYSFSKGENNFYNTMHSLGIAYSF